MNTESKDQSVDVPQAHPAAIEVDSLTVSYGPVPALLDVSLKIPVGELTGVIGPNGSGKSTLVKALLGFLRPDFGTIRLFGESIEQSKGRVAYVPQRGSVDWDFPVTVREVALMGRYGRAPWWKSLRPEDYEIADEALEMVRMTPFRDRQIGQLSGGQQQRAAIARALYMEPKILLADEPTGSLDERNAEAVMRLLTSLARQLECTLLLVTHSEKVAEHMEGRIRLQGGQLHVMARS
mgnify:CR=1 FL=1